MIAMAIRFSFSKRKITRIANGFRASLPRTHGTRWRCSSLAALLLAAGCLIERPASEPLEDSTLAFSSPVCARPEGRLSSSALLPDTVFGRIAHLDMHADAFTVVDALGKFVALVSYDLDVLQVVGRPGQGPGELVRPVAARLDDHRILVMDQATRRISAYSRLPQDTDVRATNNWFTETVADLRSGPNASMGTDFAVLEDLTIAIPVHEGPTHLAGEGPSVELIRKINPVHRDEATERQLLRLFDRVATVGLGLVVWDDDEAMLILATEDRESRWRLPHPYRGTHQPRMSRAPDARGVAISLPRPRMVGWTAEKGSVCMAVRPFGAQEVDLLWVTWAGALDSPPTLRSIHTLGHGEPVSCGLVGDRLLVVTETDIVILRLDDSDPCEGA